MKMKFERIKESLQTQKAGIFVRMNHTDQQKTSIGSNNSVLARLREIPRKLIAHPGKAPLDACGNHRKSLTA